MKVKFTRLLVAGTVTVLVAGAVALTVPAMAGSLALTPAATPTCGSGQVTRNVIHEGGFESASNTAKYWHATGGAARGTSDNNYTPDKGVWFGGIGAANGGTAILSQTIAMPSSATGGGFLHFWVHVDTTETTTTSAFDTMDVQLVFGTDVQPVDRFSNLDDPKFGHRHGIGGGTVWQYAYYGTNGFHPGHNVELQFVVHEDGSLGTAFQVDAVYFMVAC